QRRRQLQPGRLRGAGAAAATAAAVRSPADGICSAAAADVRSSASHHDGSGAELFADANAAAARGEENELAPLRRPRRRRGRALPASSEARARSVTMTAHLFSVWYWPAGRYSYFLSPTEPAPVAAGNQTKSVVLGKAPDDVLPTIPAGARFMGW